MRRIYIKNVLKYLNKKVKVMGWVQVKRVHGKIIFFDVRDRTGLLQVVLNPQDLNKKKELNELVKEIKPEWVISVEGKIKNRPKEMINFKIETGEIELRAEKIEVFSRAKTLPFSIETLGYEVNEEKRLKYRYLDLRRERLQKNLIVRNRFIKFIRDYLFKKDFIEIETPILTKSTPEGARDFVVPARLDIGNFFALPQSPQQYKQLLMVAGLERYFQLARCFRDEDPRADRQAEFTQLDLEMSFMDQEEILDLTEKFFIKLIKNIFPEKKIQKIPFPRITYQEAMTKYGRDNPDLRKNKKDLNELAFVFVVDFPMFEWREQEKRWDAVHHPFTRPQVETITEIKKNPVKILAYQYDLVINGQEVGGGSLRTYQPEILEVIFEILGHKKENIKKNFGHLLEAFEYGVPPHGGIAFGLDRILAILLNEPNIREVMTFPKTGDNRDLMMGAPTKITKEQLKELHLIIKKS